MTATNDPGPGGQRDTDPGKQPYIRCWNGYSCPGVGGECGRCRAWLCTPQTPFPGQKPRTPFQEQQPRARHPLAQEVRDSQRNGWPGGDLVQMICPVCGSGWEQELPQ